MARFISLKDDTYINVDQIVSAKIVQAGERESLILKMSNGDKFPYIEGIEHGKIENLIIPMLSSIEKADIWDELSE